MFSPMHGVYLDLLWNETVEWKNAMEIFHWKQNINSEAELKRQRLDEWMRKQVELSTAKFQKII